MPRSKSSVGKRKAKRFSHAIKLWFEPKMYEGLTTIAAQQRWEVPEVVRLACEELLANPPTPPRPRMQAPTPPRSYAETAAAVLAAHGEPMRLKDLSAAMEARGVRVGGETRRNRRTNLIIALKRAGRFRRLGEGMYTLADATPAPKRKPSDCR